LKPKGRTILQLPVPPSPQQGSGREARASKDARILRVLQTYGKGYQQERICIFLPDLYRNKLAFFNQRDKEGTQAPVVGACRYFQWSAVQIVSPRPTKKPWSRRAAVQQALSIAAASEGFQADGVLPLLSPIRRSSRALVRISWRDMLLDFSMVRLRKN
jgi:hypothetical protein